MDFWLQYVYFLRCLLVRKNKYNRGAISPDIFSMNSDWGTLKKILRSKNFLSDKLSIVFDWVISWTSVLSLSLWHLRSPHAYAHFLQCSTWMWAFDFRESGAGRSLCQRNSPQQEITAEWKKALFPFAASFPFSLTTMQKCFPVTMRKRKRELGWDWRGGHTHAL